MLYLHWEKLLKGYLSNLNSLGCAEPRVVRGAFSSNCSRIQYLGQYWGNHAIVIVFLIAKSTQTGLHYARWIAKFMYMFCSVKKFWVPFGHVTPPFRILDVQVYKRRFLPWIGSKCRQHCHDVQYSLVLVHLSYCRTYFWTRTLYVTHTNPPNPHRSFP
jgi:hypothetical protein